MKKERLEKLEALALQLLPEIIFDEIDKEELQDFWLLTITKVKISTDLSYLDIFVSSIKNIDLLPKFLASHNGKIQRRFNKSLDLRKFPRIRYRIDKSWENSSKILEELKKVEDEIKKEN